MLSISPWPRKRLIFSLSLLVSFCFIGLHKDLGAIEFPNEGEYRALRNEKVTDLTCASLEGVDDVFVILKTGANEAPEKLPVHLRTTLDCIPHYGIWSDLEENISGHHVSNALDEVDPEVIAGHPDFEYYRRLQEQGRYAFSADEQAKWANAQNTISGRDTPGWKLDKWKFLPLADKAYRQRPEAKWFIFMECDTFIIWKNLLAWLSTMDASKPLYLGHQMRVGDVVFAYGGSGIVISNPAMKALVEHRATNLKFYDDFTGQHWAGDCVLGKAMLDAGVKLTWSWPTLLGDAVSELDFNSTFGNDDVHPWCYYATSYHHLSPLEIFQYDGFERKWRKENASTLLRHGDIFRYLVLPKIQPEIADWDNLSADEQNSESGTLADCRSVCENQSDCVQFSLTGRICRTSKIVKLGHDRQQQDLASGRVYSGWMMDRVAAFVDEMDASCRGEDWMLP
ncbi:hypothetical protein DL768_002733 [Monosporascus sp. mg162]|nr:hypothetical protein DL768_002733 [Monosporascus sp. mg162]